MERRNTRRMARYWVFLAIAYFAWIGTFFYLSVIHMLGSSLSASIGSIGPRYLMGGVGFYYLTGFVLVIVFLGFDIRAKDIRDGIVEVLDSRPLTNLELVIGRFVGLFWSAWIPIVVLVVLVQGLAWLLPLLGSPIGRTIEPLSLVYFVFMMAVPAIAFAISLVFVITLLVRHRLVAALLTIAAIVGLYWMMLTVTGPYTAYFDFIGAGQQAFASDIVPAISRPGGFLQRLGLLILAFGLVGLAGAIHPRLDGQSRLRPAFGSAALIVISLVTISMVSQQRVAEAAALEQWQTAHEARAGEPIADIRSIEGFVAIDPGRSVDAELQIEVAAPADAGMTNLLFTLNPGFVVDEVRSSDGAVLQTEHADGLLDIELDRPLGPAERTVLTVQYSGRPNTNFGYLDSTIVTETLNLNEQQVGLLGYERGIFDHRHVALTPGIRWLPAGGPDVGRDDRRDRRADYFALALEIELPEDWLVAGPGRREQLGSSDESVRFRFAPQTSLPEVALVAGEFESFATEIRGITFEVLVVPKHVGNLEFMADARGEIEQWIDERLEIAADAGIAYPFDAFTVVEVPTTLRGYQGGWRLDSALAPPAMLLLRESGFPTARFDFDVFADARNPDQDGGEARIARNRLVNFFSNDFSGGNVFAAAAKSFFVHQTSAFGPDAIAVDFVLDELATLFVSGRRSYFSAHLFANINQAIASITGSLQGQGFSGFMDAVLDAQTSQTDVWNTVLSMPLAEVDPYADPQRTIDMLVLKGGSTAEVVRDTLGPEAIGQLLALLLERHSGEAFSYADLVAAGDVVSDELAPLLNDWISGTGLPGFVVRGVEQFRLPDDEGGNARYQLLVRLSNDEPVVGFARVNWNVLDTDVQGSVSIAISSGGVNARVALPTASTSDPIRIPGRSAIEFGVVLNLPVASVTIDPYLSLNRDEFTAGDLNPSADAIPSRDVEAFDGIREIPFEFDEGERIIADDLDEAFTIVTEAAEGTLRLTASENRELILGFDQGLPVAFGLAPPQWSRRALDTSWGRYRHTLAYVGAGDGRRRAIMPVTIPNAGRYELEIHVPPLFQAFRGVWNLEIVSDNGREAVRYDAALSSNGWNLVGQYELPAGQVSVELSDETDGRLVIADAIAWSPVGTGAESQDENSP